MTAIIAGACLIVVSSSNAQTNPPLVPTAATNPTAASGGTNAADAAYSVADERKAWILALRKFSETKEHTGIDWQSVSNTLAGGVLTGLVTFLALLYSTKNERAKMRHEAAIKAGESSRQAAVAYANQLQEQVNLLFGPLDGFLQVSRGLYRKMEMQLLEDPANFRKVPDLEQGEKLQLRVPPNDDGKWKDFRLLDQMPALKQKPLYRPLPDEIMRIGQQTTDLIQKHGGLLHGGGNVSDVYGEYLAHYGILKSIHLDAARTEAYPPGKHQIGYYPRRLNNIVKARYDALLAELRPYHEANQAALAEFQRMANTTSGRKKK